MKPHSILLNLTLRIKLAKEIGQILFSFFVLWWENTNARLANDWKFGRMNGQRQPMASFLSQKKKNGIIFQMFKDWKKAAISKCKTTDVLSSFIFACLIYHCFHSFRASYFFVWHLFSFHLWAFYCCPLL